MIEFEVYSEKPDDKAIVARYWAMGEDGKFVEQVGDVLYEFFGIDEDTPGSTVMSMFSEPITEEGEFSDPPAEVIEEQVCTLMRRAIAHNLESAAIVFFAECIRDGANIKAALDSVFSAYPVLTE